MTSRSPSDLCRVLRSRSRAIVDRWYDAVKVASLSLHSPAELRQLLAGLFERVVGLLVVEDPDLSEARAIGGSFVPLRLPAGAFGRVQAALIEELSVAIPSDLAAVLHPRVALLMHGLIAGFVERDRATLLDEQERIRDAHVRALRSAQRELLLKNAGIESSINAICFCNLEGKVTYVNSAFLDMWAYDSPDDVIGRDIGDFGQWDYRQRQVAEALDREDGWIGELVACRESGATFHVQVSASMIRDDTGRPVQVMTSFVDITERKRVEAALARRVSEMTFLNQIGDQIAALRAPEQVLHKTVHLVHEAFDYHQVGVLTVDPERNDLIVTAVAGEFEGHPPRDRRIPVGEGVTGWVAEHGQMLVVNDVRADSRYLMLIPKPVPTRSELAVPIMADGEVVAVLDVQSPCVNAFEESDSIVMGTLADQVSVAMENARLYAALQRELAQRREAEARLRRNVRRLETLRDLDQAILIAKSAEEVARAALRHLRRLVPCQRAAIDLIDFEADEVTVLAAMQTIGERKAGTGARFPLTQQRLIFEMLGDRHSAYVKDIRQLPQSSLLIRTLRSEGLRSFVLAPIAFRDQLLGLVSLGSEREAGFEPEHRPIVEEVADLVAIAIQQARLHDSVRRQGERLRDAMARLGEAEEAERRAVVRTLHDRVGQNLTALDLNLSTVQSKLRDRNLPDLCARLGNALRVVEETNEHIRGLMADLRPPVLDDYGLLAALRWHADQFAEQTGVPVDVRGDEQAAARLAAHVENALFRIAQEALNNVAKHAEANRVSVDLLAQEAGVRLIISDDGVGFDPEELGPERSSWGLLTMRERAESVGARFAVESCPHEGTRVIVEAPG